MQSIYFSEILNLDVIEIIEKCLYVPFNRDLVTKSDAEVDITSSKQASMLKFNSKIKLHSVNKPIEFCNVLKQYLIFFFSK